MFELICCASSLFIPRMKSLYSMTRERDFLRFAARWGFRPRVCRRVERQFRAGEAPDRIRVVYQTRERGLFQCVERPLLLPSPQQHSPTFSSVGFPRPLVCSIECTGHFRCAPKTPITLSTPNLSPAPKVPATEPGASTKEPGMSAVARPLP